MFAVLDPTSFLPIDIDENDFSSVFNEAILSLDAILSSQRRGDGQLKVGCCSDTSSIIYNNFRLWVKQGPKFQEFAKILLNIASKCSSHVTQLEGAVEAELQDAVTSADEFSADKFSSFANLLGGVTQAVDFDGIVVVGTSKSKLPCEGSDLVTKLITESEIISISIPYVSNDIELAKLGIFSTDLFNKLLNVCPVKFVWEKTGHGASTLQQRVIMQTASNSKVVIRSGTTYQNPNSRASRSKVELTDKYNEIFYSVLDDRNLIKGFFSTNATTHLEQTICFSIVKVTLDCAIEQG